MKSILVYNNKGGVGKTTMVTGIATVLSTKKKVLVIDTDQQGNLTTVFGFERHAKTYKQTLAKCIENILDETDEKTSDFIQHTDNPNIDILIGGMEMESIRPKVEQAYGQAINVYQDILMDIEEQCDYDYILIDTPPYLGAEITALLLTVDYALIPTTTSRYAIDGLTNVLRLFNNCARPRRGALKLLGIVLNNVVLKNAATKETIPEVREAYGDKVFDAVIEKSATVETMEWNGFKIINNKYSTQLIAVTREVVKRIEED